MPPLIASRPGQPVPAAAPTAVGRPRPRPLALALAARYGAIGLAVALIGGATTWGWADGWFARQAAALYDGVLAITADAGFAVRDVLVVGRGKTDRDALLAALAVGRGDPIFAVDPAKAQEAIVALPWVRRAVVERRLPDTILVHLEERRPLAIWQSERRMRVIDADGVVLVGQNLGAFATLPLVVGADAPRHASDLLAQLAAQPDIARRVAAAIRVGGRRWDLRLDNGINVRLPTLDVAVALTHLAAMESAGGLIDRDIVAIDLRIADRLVVQTTPAAGERRRLPGENT